MVTNNWHTVPTILGLVVFGIGRGALVTLVFNVLVTASPKELAGDVGSVRGTTQNLASAVGTAVAGALLVSLLTLSLGRALVERDYVPEEIAEHTSLQDPNFIPNDQLRASLEETGASAEQVEEFVSPQHRRAAEGTATGSAHPLRGQCPGHPPGDTAPRLQAR